MCGQSHLFDRRVVGDRILVSRCLLCGTKYASPRAELLFMVESAHECPAAEEAARSAGGSGG